MMRALLGLGTLATLFLCSCQVSNSPLVQQRNAQIAMETPGDYYIGRRYWVKGSRTWGWVRRPRQPWDKAKLVVTNERFKRNPDRFPEFRADGGPVNGSDHNREYRIEGYFSGDRVYDPTTNLILPEFVLRDWKLVSSNPGFLFSPDERMSNARLLRSHVLPLTQH